ILVATPTLVDPSRAPEGHHTVKFLSGQAWELPEGESSWDELKERQADRQLERVRRLAPGLTDDVIVARLVKSPADIERQNRHMIHGTFHGGDRGPAQSGGLRPAPGWRWRAEGTGPPDRHEGAALDAGRAGRGRPAGGPGPRGAVSRHFGKSVWMVAPALAPGATRRSVAEMRRAHQHLDPTAERV